MDHELASWAVVRAKLHAGPERRDGSQDRSAWRCRSVRRCGCPSRKRRGAASRRCRTGAKTLLLAQTHCVIGFSAATGAAVLARSIRTLFEDALSLRGQSDAEGAGKTHLTAGTLNVRHWFNPLFVLSLSERNVCRSPAYAEPASPVLLRAMRERLDPQCRTPRMAADPLMG